MTGKLTLKIDISFFVYLQSPKFAPPIEFVDQATLSPPEGYKDGTLLDSALSDALSNHVFGAQHIQQLQVIQRLQQQRAAMLAARAATASNVSSAISSQQPTPPPPPPPTSTANDIIDPQQQGEVCLECTQCSECAAAKLAELEAGGESMMKMRALITVKSITRNVVVILMTLG